MSRAPVSHEEYLTLLLVGAIEEAADKIATVFEESTTRVLEAIPDASAPRASSPADIELIAQQFKVMKSRGKPAHDRILELLKNIRFLENTITQRDLEIERLKALKRGDM